MVLNENQKIVAELALKLSKEKLAPNAAKIDRERSFPTEGLQQIAKADLLGLTVPETLSGTGADIPSYLLAAEAIAEGCASTALVYITHPVVARAIALAASDEMKKILFKSFN